MAVITVSLMCATLMGCQNGSMRDEDLTRSASDRGGTIRIVALDSKRETAVIERIINTGDLLHDGKFLEEYRFTNGVWQCVSSPIH